MTNPFPPPNYIATESAVAGIEVYAPAPPEPVQQAEVIDFHCPQCGATTAFSAREGALKCAHCGYVEQPEAEIVGKRAKEFEFTVETVERAASGWGVERKDVECQSCGAYTSVPAGQLSATCPFCGSNKVVQRMEAQDVLRPRFLVPFKVQPDACRTIAATWLGSSWMTPSSLNKLANLAVFTPIYIPYWTFDSTTSASWKAEVGHTTTERYYSNGEWKTRTKTVWRWESGQVRLAIDDLLVEGTRRLSALLLSKMDNYNMRELCPYEPKFLAGVQAQAYDISLEDAWETGRNRMREATRKECVGQASTSMVRNFSMNLDFSDESWRYILLPLYLATYSFQNKTYQVMINGQTGVIAGQRPVDWTKVWLVIAAILIPGVLLGIAGLVTLPLGGIGAIIGGLGFILLVAGLVAAIWIFIKAQGLDDA